MTAPFKVERRRSFGLDHARHRDPTRVAQDVMGEIAEQHPGVLPIRVDADGSATPMLLLVPPDGPMALLRIGTRRRDAPEAPVRQLEAACRRLRMPCTSLSRIEDLPGALRRCGLDEAEA